MNFENQPENWTSIPLSDPDHIADVLDLFVGLSDRHAGSLVVIICDAQRRPIQPVAVNGISAMPPAEGVEFLERLARTVAECVPGGSVLCALARRRQLRVTMKDQAWRRCIEAAFAGHTELIGVHLVTCDGCIPIPALGAAA